MAKLYTEEWVLGHDKIRFYTRKYEPPQGIANAKAAMLFLHGYVEHIARYSHVFPLWASRGVAVYAFDQRGFGRTAEGDGVHKGTGATRTTTEDAMDDVAWFLHRLGEWAGEGKKLFLVGHSMGGFNALNFLCSPPSRSASLPPLSGLAILSPLISLTHPPHKLERTGLSLLSCALPNWTVSARVKPEHLSRDPAVSKAYAEDPLVYKRGTLRGLRTMLDAVDHLRTQGYRSYPAQLPLLWIHGTADEVNSFHASKELYEKVKAKEKTFREVEGGFHELLNEPQPVKEMVLDEVCAWVLGVAEGGTPEGAKARL